MKTIGLFLSYVIASTHLYAGAITHSLKVPGMEDEFEVTVHEPLLYATDAASTSRRIREVEYLNSKSNGTFHVISAYSRSPSSAIAWPYVTIGVSSKFKPTQGTLTDEQWKHFKSGLPQAGTKRKVSETLNVEYIDITESALFAISENSVTLATKSQTIMDGKQVTTFSAMKILRVKNALITLYATPAPESTIEDLATLLRCLEIK